MLTASRRLVAQLGNNTDKSSMMDELVSSYQHVRVYFYAHMGSTYHTNDSDRLVELFLH